ncbi:hypothetical protein ABK040_007106 [Willaertia magna]
MSQEFIPDSAIDTEHLNCSICFDVVTNNRECNQCGAIFCYQCINQWVEMKHCCPNCKKENVNIKDEKDFSNFIKNQFVERLSNNLTMTCPLKCGLKVTRGNLNDHVNKFCSNRPISCTAQKYGCDWKGTSKEYQESHCKECKFISLKPFMEKIFLEKLEVLKRLNININSSESYFKKAKEIILKINYNLQWDDIDKKNILENALEKSLFLLKAIIVNRENLVSKNDLYMEFKKVIDYIVVFIKDNNKIEYLLNRINEILYNNNNLQTIYNLQNISYNNNNDDDNKRICLLEYIMYTLIKAWIFEALENNTLAKKDFETITYIYQELKQQNNSYLGNILLESNYLFSFAYFSLGRFYQLSERSIEKAIEYYTISLGLDNKFSICLNNRGICFQSVNQMDSAFKDFSSCIEYETNYAKAYMNRSKIYQTHYNDVDSALKDLNKAIELEPNFAKSYALRGAIYESIKNNKKALKDYKRAYELDSNTYRQFVVKISKLEETLEQVRNANHTNFTHKPPPQPQPNNSRQNSSGGSSHNTRSTPSTPSGFFKSLFKNK